MLVVEGQSQLGYESFIWFDNEQIELDAVKKSEDGKFIVVRFHEFAGSAQNVKMQTGFKYKAWVEGDLRERPLSTEFQQGEITLSMHAYEIKTILLEVE